LEKKLFSDPRWHSAPRAVPSQCNTCRHYLGFGECEGFGGRIPREIANNHFKHDKPYPGDSGMQYEAKP
jgi:hypothetical protein